MRIPKRFAFVICLLALSVTSHAGQGAEYVNSYFELWLKAHNFTDFEKRQDGIYFPKQGVLLDGEISEAKELKPGAFYSVESRISITFKNGRRLDDFVAGAGAKVDQALYDSLQNFCLTTLHPLYAELFDHQDPHVRKETWVVSGVQRRIFLSEWGKRGFPIDESTQKKAELLISEELRNLKMSGDIHWIKLLASGYQGKLNALVVTVDGVKSERLTQRLAESGWPTPNDFYMAKLFIVVGGV
jgi:hypothetical protein